MFAWLLLPRSEALAGLELTEILCLCLPRVVTRGVCYCIQLGLDLCRSGVTGSGGCWDWNLGPLQHQSVFLTAGGAISPALLGDFFFFFFLLATTHMNGQPVVVW